MVEKIMEGIKYSPPEASKDKKSNKPSRLTRFISQRLGDSQAAQIGRRIMGEIENAGENK